MKKTIIIGIFLIISFCWGKAQEPIKEIISAAGARYSTANADVKLTWSIGDPVVESFFYNAISKLTDENETGEDNYKLSQYYPNPFNRTTNIDYCLPENADVKLTLLHKSVFLLNINSLIIKTH